MSRVRKNTEGSRAAYYGINASALARDAQNKIAKIRLKLLQLQEPWIDCDPVLEKATEQVLAALDALNKQYSDSAEYMQEMMSD